MNHNSLQRLPQWVVKKAEDHREIHRTKALLRSKKLNTVCESARCPNIVECFARPTATFMILGDRCSRNCGFCSVSAGEPQALNPQEANSIASAVGELGLKHVVLTSVTRDDLPDGGAAHFARCIETVRNDHPQVTVEVLTPDFQGREKDIKTVIVAGPDIFNHNLETVPRLYPVVRSEADYHRSLELLRLVKSEGLTTKSGIMVGLGENEGEVETVLSDLRSVGCDRLTVGQYLRPTRHNLPVAEYKKPEYFDRIKKQALGMGFSEVTSTPLARSSFYQETKTLRKTFLEKGFPQTPF
jgi:lipoic acid synthetase